MAKSPGERTGRFLLKGLCERKGNHMSQTEYVSGVCNIGPQEVAIRRKIGWISLAVAVVLLALLIGARVNPLWRFFVFFPAALSATGFIQAHFHFCAGHAHRGIFNFGSLGQSVKIDDPSSKILDKRKGNQIFLYSILIGAAVAVLCVVEGYVVQ